MATKEERAKEWSKHYIGKNRRDIVEIAYRQGANDQESITRKEMIDKAWEWINEGNTFANLKESFYKAMEQ